MSQESSAPLEASSDSKRDPVYEPFPPFEEWTRVDFETSTIDIYEQQFTDARASVSVEIAQAAILKATKIAAVDTGAIEGLYTVDRGFTRSVAEASASWEILADERGSDVRRAISDALNAYEYVLDLATKHTPISQKAIRELHAVAIAGQETYRVFASDRWEERVLPKGEYKQYLNNPTRADGTTHAYCPPGDVSAEMTRLIDELASDSFAGAHPVVQASYAHYAYVCIHPFADGNGRVARALASVYLYRRPGVPLVVWADQRDTYLQALEAADRGEGSVLTQFISTCLLDTLDLLADQLAAPTLPSVSEVASSLADVLRAQSGLTFHQVDGLASRLLDEAGGEFSKILSTLQIGPTVRHSVAFSNASPRPAPDGYRSVVSNDRILHVVIFNDPPGAATAEYLYTVFVARSSSIEPSYLLVNLVGETVMRARSEQLHPLFGASLRTKLESFVQREVSNLLSQVELQIANALAKEGYAST